MNQIYLVCTRSAISASALTYIINQSPQFYNVVHNNLWITEEGSEFNNATVIEDWWNIPSSYAETYTHTSRNNEKMSVATLSNLHLEWTGLNTGKDIALFTHATNVEEIVQWRDKYNLPIKVITTIMGKNSYNYMELFLKREYSDEMNKFISLKETWKYLYNQYQNQDINWATHADVVLSMEDWLEDATSTYSKLDIEPNTNIKSWITEYKQKNGYEDWDINVNSIANKLKTISYLYQLHQHQFHTLQAKTLYALAILEAVRKNRGQETTIVEITSKVQNIIRNQLTIV
jgi:hypothetical protein|tara:strand:+ start:43 stop:909 length:867 start_codon:yes stop_codon:yes gene_type:complete